MNEQDYWLRTPHEDVWLYPQKLSWEPLYFDDEVGHDNGDWWNYSASLQEPVVHAAAGGRPNYLNVGIAIRKKDMVITDAPELRGVIKVPFGADEYVLYDGLHRIGPCVKR